MLLPQVEAKLKNEFYAQIFLDSDGLELLGRMIQRLPNGSLPNPTFRGKVLALLLTLPVTSDNIQRSNVGKSLTVLEKSGEEIAANMRMIKEIKEKWSRILCRVTYDYKMDNEFEGDSNKRRLNSPFVASHIRDPTKMTTNYKDIEASQVRRIKRRYDFEKAPPSNAPVEKGSREKVG